MPEGKHDDGVLEGGAVLYNRSDSRPSGNAKGLLNRVNEAKLQQRTFRRKHRRATNACSSATHRNDHRTDLHGRSLIQARRNVARL